MPEGDGKPAPHWGFLIFSICMMGAAAVAVGLILMWPQIQNALGI